MIKIVKRLGILSSCFLLFFMLSGCTNVYFTNMSSGSVTGQGSTITKTYDVESYNAVEINTTAIICYTAEKSDKLVIDMKENLEEFLQVKVVGGVLTVSSTANISRVNDYHVTIYLSSENLNELQIDGDCSFKNMDEIAGDELKLYIDGAAEGSLLLNVNSLTVGINGVGSLAFTGTADTADYKVDGVGTIDALDMPTGDISIHMYGVGSLDVNCLDSLDVEIDGLGIVSYTGTGHLTSVSGDGTVNRIE